jgi:membrane protein implicated in regulation of membrane protease activity
MEKVKKISKYVLNSLTIVNALLTGLAPIWDIPFADKAIATISVFMAVIATYLLGDKAVSKTKQKTEESVEVG